MQKMQNKANPIDKLVKPYYIQIYSLLIINKTYIIELEIWDYPKFNNVTNQCMTSS